MEAQWETFTSKSASPGSSPCWMLPLANLCGLHWVNTAPLLLVSDIQTVCVRAGLTFTNVSLLSQLCRTALKAPTGTRGTRSCTVKISCDLKEMCFPCFCWKDDLLATSFKCLFCRINTEWPVFFFRLAGCSSHVRCVVLCVAALLMKLKKNCFLELNK